MPETFVSFKVTRPITEWEKSDIEHAIAAIMEARSFFYAGDGELGDEIRKFLVDNPIDTNLELVEE